MSESKSYWEQFVSSDIKGWKNYKIGDIFEHRVEKNNPNFPLLAITGKRGVVRRNTLERRDTSNSDKSKYLLIRKGDIAYNTMRMWQGVSGLSEFDGLVSPAYTVCKPLDVVDGKYVSFLFKLPALVQIFHQNSQGLVDDTLNLKFEHLKKIRCKLPPLPEQEKIANILTSVDTVIDKTQAQIDKLKELKTGMMQELFTKGIGPNGKPHSDFKDSSVGRIPAEWDVLSLGTIAEFRNGLNYSAENSGTGLRVIGVGDFQNYDYPIIDSLAEINPAGVANDEDMLRENDFIFVRSNGNRRLIGRCMIIKNLGDEKVSFSGFVIRCRIKSEERIDFGFLNHVFKSRFIRDSISADGAGTNISNLNQQILSKLDIVVPPRFEQKKITNVLDSVASRLSSCHEKLNCYKALKKALMRDLLTGIIRTTPDSH